MRITLILLVVSALFLIACDVESPTGQPGVVEEEVFEPTEEYFDASYQDGVLVLEGAVEKPSPCHRVRFLYGFVERTPNTLVLDYDVLPPPEGETCAQVVSYEAFNYEAEYFGIKGAQVVSDGSIKFRRVFD